MFVIKKWHL